VWLTRWPKRGSVHLIELSELPADWADPALDEKWQVLRQLRTQVTEAIEPLRRDKVIGSSLEAEVTVPSDEDPALLAELFITSTVHKGDEIKVTKTANHKCGRCWRYMPDVKQDGDLDARCREVVNG
jgi:isoleucyl-tRNA synthetase